MKVVNNSGIYGITLERKSDGFAFCLNRTASIFSAPNLTISLSKTTLILADIKQKGNPDSLEIVERILAGFDTAVVYVAGYVDGKTLKRAKITQPLDCLHKPFTKRELHSAIEMALYKRSTEKKLRENEKCLHTTLSNIDSAVITADARGLIAHVNPPAQALIGFSEKEVLGRDLSQIFNVIDPETRTAATIGLGRDSILVARNGKEIHISHKAEAVRDEKGGITGLVLVFSETGKHLKERGMQAPRDESLKKAYQDLALKIEEHILELARINEELHLEVAERKRNEESIRESEARYRSLIENLPIGVYGTAPDSSITIGNAALVSMLGYSSLDEMTSLHPKREPRDGR